MSSKPLVIVIGASGTTGESVVQGLLASGNFRIAAIVRPTSAMKPATKVLRAAGVEIRLASLTDGVEKLAQTLAGAEIVISTVAATATEAQADAIRAAKAAGVKRFVPCDFATPGAKGVREDHDQKLVIRELVVSIGLGHTIIDIGWWAQLFLPRPSSWEAPLEGLRTLANSMCADGDKPCLVTDLRNVGKWVARIIVDPRTLNKKVIVWEDEKTLKEAFDIAERLVGAEELKVMKALGGHLTPEDLRTRVTEGRAANSSDPIAKVYVRYYEYLTSLHVLGEDTLQNAKDLGYLDARELYPDIPQQSFEAFAQDFYGGEHGKMVFKRASWE